MFAPDNVSTAAPFFTIRPDPLITPLKVVALELPTVSVWPCKFTKPAPPKAPISSELDSFKDAPEPMLTVEPFAKAEPPERFNVPALTVNNPLETFVPERVNSANPSFTRLPVPAMLPPNVTAESTVRFVFASSETPPPNERVPDFALLPNVPPTDNARRFAKTRPVAESLETRPPLKVSVPVPNARLDPISIVPALIVTPPLKVFEPLKPRTAPPFFTRLPPAPLITPEKFVEVPPLSVSALFCSAIEPAPRMPANSSELESFNSAPPATSANTAFAIAAPPAKFKVPPKTDTEPENVLAALSVSSPDPDFDSPEAPLTTPLKSTELAIVRLLLPAKETPFVKVSEPEFTASPSVAAPFNTTAFESRRASVESLETRPPVISNDPVPSAVFVPSRIAPPLNFTPPANELLPVSVSTAVPVFTSVPDAPLITPAYVVEVPPLKVSVLVSSLVCPAPAMLAICSEADSFSVPTAPTVSAMESASAEPPASVRIPAFTAVVPEKVLLPARINSPAPALLKRAVPDTTPPSFT